MRLIKNSNGLCFLEVEELEKPTKIYINVNEIESIFDSDEGLIIVTTNDVCPKIKGTIAEMFDVLGCYAAPTHDPNDDEVPF